MAKTPANLREFAPTVSSSTSVHEGSPRTPTTILQGRLPSRRGNGYLVTLAVSAAIASLFVIVILALESSTARDRDLLYNSPETQKTLRLYQEGDEWIYRITGEVDQSDGSKVSDIVDGASRVTVSKVTVQGGSRYVQFHTLTIAIQSNGDKSQADYTETYMQSPTTHALYKLSDTRGPDQARRVASGTPQISVPGVFSATSKTESHVTFDNSESVDDIRYVASAASGAPSKPEVVAVPAGSFTGWNYHSESINHRTAPRVDFKLTTDGVFVPGIGNYASWDTTRVPASAQASITREQYRLVKVNL